MTLSTSLNDLLEEASKYFQNGWIGAGFIVSVFFKTTSQQPRKGSKSQPVGQKSQVHT